MPRLSSVVTAPPPTLSPNSPLSTSLTSTSRAKPQSSGGRHNEKHTEKHTKRHTKRHSKRPGAAPSSPKAAVSSLLSRYEATGDGLEDLLSLCQSIPVGKERESARRSIGSPELRLKSATIRDTEVWLRILEAVNAQVKDVGEVLSRADSCPEAALSLIWR
jgi:hypothetical protein